MNIKIIANNVAYIVLTKNNDELFSILLIVLLPSATTYGIDAKLESKTPILESRIERNKPLKKWSNAVLSDEEIDLFRVPRLMNYVPDDKYDTFISKMSLIDKGILGKIADIEYTPNDYDKDRFLLYMDDGNMVYLTLTKFKQINYYNEVLEQLEGRKGILYLDSGNHFQIKE